MTKKLIFISTCLLVAQGAYASNHLAACQQISGPTRANPNAPKLTQSVTLDFDFKSKEIDASLIAYDSSGTQRTVIMKNLVCRFAKDDSKVFTCSGDGSDYIMISKTRSESVLNIYSDQEDVSETYNLSLYQQGANGKGGFIAGDSNHFDSPAAVNLRLQPFTAEECENSF